MPRDFTTIEKPKLPSGLARIIAESRDCQFPQDVRCDEQGNASNAGNYYLMFTGENTYELWRRGEEIEMLEIDGADTVPYRRISTIGDKLVATYHTNLD